MILHIPHSSTVLPVDYPALDGRSVHAYTAHLTDRLFERNGTDMFVFPYSRFFVDVQRTLDDPHDAEGHGWFHTHDYHGNQYRLSPRGDELTHYEAWHTRLRAHVEARLAVSRKVVLVDCHAFGDAQFAHLPDAPPTPDICIGANADGSSPDALIALVEQGFMQRDYQIAINHPYVGAIKFSDQLRFETVMINVNKRVYLGRGNAQFERVKADIGEVLAAIQDYERAAA